MSFFQLLPPEINLQILLHIPACQMMELCQQSEFKDICDWHYWRTKAQIDLSIPHFYFDLALDRGISGDRRYLEVSFRLHPSLHALAEINDGIISGIYEPETMLSIAFDRNLPELVQELIPKVSMEFLKHLYFEKITRGFFPSQFSATSLYQTPPKQALIGHLTIYSLLAKGIGKDVFVRQSLPQIYFDLEAKNWEAVGKQISNVKDFSKCQFILALIYSQNDQAWSIAQSYIPLNGPVVKGFYLRAALQCGNKNQVDWILQYLPKLKLSLIDSVLILSNLVNTLEPIIDTETLNSTNIWVMITSSMLIVGPIWS